ncbi:MAG: NAD(P)H-binding protein, partial [Leptospirales bacterium]
MQIIIFGATGGTGRHLLGQALNAGHRVTAFVRDPRRIAIQHKHLSLVQGDVLDEAAVVGAIGGHDAVLCALGAPAHRTGVVRSRGTKNILRGMRNAGVRRLICQTSM